MRNWGVMNSFFSKSIGGLWRLFLIGLFVGCSLGAARAQELSNAQLDQLLGRLEQLQSSTPGLTANFKETRTSRILTEPMVSKGELKFRAPAFFRREIKGSRPSLTVSDGEILWIYYPKFKEAERYEIGRGQPVDEAVQALLAGMNFNRVKSSYQIEAEKVGDGYELELRPKTSALRKMFKSMVLTLDRQLNVIQSDVQLSRGDSVKTEFSSIRRGTPSKSDFRYTPPEGTRISEPLR